MKKTKIILATNNQGKIKEFMHIYSSLKNIEFITPNDIGLTLNVSETGDTYLANATLKAQAFAKISGLIALADDSGLEVDALGGAPGIFSARFSPLENATDEDRRKHMIHELRGKQSPWYAKFICSIVIANPENIAASFEGICEGQIISDERGKNGFGYDPIFLIHGQKLTMAQLSEDEKNKISHRAQAAQASLEFLQSLSMS